MLLLYAVLALAFLMLDIMLMCILFHADRRGDRLMQGFAILLHLAASFATPRANQMEAGCAVSLPIVVIVLLVAVLALMRTAPPSGPPSSPAFNRIPSAAMPAVAATAGARRRSNRGSEPRVRCVSATPPTGYLPAPGPLQL